MKVQKRVTLYGLLLCNLCALAITVGPQARTETVQHQEMARQVPLPFASTPLNAWAQPPSAHKTTLVIQLSTARHEFGPSLTMMDSFAVSGRTQKGEILFLTDRRRRPSDGVLVLTVPHTTRHLALRGYIGEREVRGWMSRLDLQPGATVQIDASMMSVVD